MESELDLKFDNLIDLPLEFLSYDWGDPVILNMSLRCFGILYIYI